MSIDVMKKGSKRGLLKSLNMVGGAIDAGMDFYFRRQDHPDENMLVSAGAAGLTYAEWALFGPAMFGLTLGELGYESAKAAVQYGASQASSHTTKYYNGGQVGGGFNDSQQAYTARQRGIQAIQQSRMNARSALGNEARSLHQR